MTTRSPGEPPPTADEEATGANRRQRRFDPHRRDRIAAAALQVIARDGLEGLTHRAVAVIADVPLGSMTYHFADKEDLLLAAVDLAARGSVDELTAVFRGCAPHEDVAGAIVQFLAILLTQHREKLTVDYELFLAARSRPELRDRQPFIPDAYDMVRPYTDEITARVLTDLVEGVLARAIVFGQQIDMADLHRRTAWVCGGNHIAPLRPSADPGGRQTGLDSAAHHSSASS